MSPTLRYSSNRSAWVLIALMAYPAVGGAWGRHGHLLTCDIAWRLSTPEVRQELKKLLTDSPHGTFAASCSWADEIRSMRPYRYAAPHHFSNIPMPSEGKRPNLMHCPEEGCVTEAIRHYHRALRLWFKGNGEDSVPPSASVYSQKPAEMLMFLGHFVGDLHQPLHVSPDGTRGGTRVAQKLSPALQEWRLNAVKAGQFGRLPWPEKSQQAVNLHVFWDHDVLLYPQKTGWKATGERLAAEITSEQRIQWQSGDIPDWAAESLQEARRILGRQAQQEPYSIEEITDDHKLALQRVKQAGTRLAGLLADIFR